VNPVLQRSIILPLIQWARAEPISRCLRELNESQWYSRDRLAALQWEKLQSLLAHCYENVPFYRKRFDALQVRPEEIRGFDDYAKLPPLTKDEVRAHREEIEETGHARRVEQCRSGGTLGEPLKLVRDSLGSAWARAAGLRCLGWFGIRMGDKQIRIWGVPLDGSAAARERRKDRALNRVRLSPFSITRENVARYYETIRGFGARYVYGYPSAVFRICQVMDELGLDGAALPIEHVVCSAETLYDHQRAYIERSLGCRVIDEYGCCEMGPIALECPDGGMHLTMENILTEFAGPDAGGGNREILLTHLNSYSMPFLRYRIGDTGKRIEAPCACGRGLDRMSFDAGRVLSMLVATDGSYVSGTVFCYIAFDIIDKLGGIKDFRAVQRARDRIEITVVKDGSFTDAVLDRFAERVRENLGADMQVEFRFMDAIPLEKSGKRLFVCSELPE
jgi:phenylacetate-CoA ligase